MNTTDQVLAEARRIIALKRSEETTSAPAAISVTRALVEIGTDETVDPLMELFEIWVPDNNPAVIEAIALSPNPNMDVRLAALVRGWSASGLRYIEDDCLRTLDIMRARRSPELAAVLGELIAIPLRPNVYGFVCRLLNTIDHPTVLADLTSVVAQVAAGNAELGTVGPVLDLIFELATPEQAWDLLSPYVTTSEPNHGLTAAIASTLSSCAATRPIDPRWVELAVSQAHHPAEHVRYHFTTIAARLAPESAVSFLVVGANPPGDAVIFDAYISDQFYVLDHVRRLRRLLNDGPPAGFAEQVMESVRHTLWSDGPYRSPFPLDHETEYGTQNLAAPRGSLLCGAPANAGEAYCTGWDEKGRVRFVRSRDGDWPYRNNYTDYDDETGTIRCWTLPTDDPNRPRALDEMFWVNERQRLRIRLEPDGEWSLWGFTYADDKQQLRFVVTELSRAAYATIYEVTCDRIGRPVVARFPKGGEIFRTPPRTAKVLFQTLQQSLRAHIVEAIRTAAIATPLHAIAIDFDSGGETEGFALPRLWADAEENRTSIKRARPDDYEGIWSPMDHREGRPVKTEALSFGAFDEHLQADLRHADRVMRGDEVEPNRLLARDAILGVAKKLNTFDWASIVPVTDDFVVYVRDRNKPWDALFEPVVAKPRIKLLRERGFLPSPQRGTKKKPASLLVPESDGLPSQGKNKKSASPEPDGAAGSEAGSLRARRFEYTYGQYVDVWEISVAGNTITTREIKAGRAAKEKTTVLDSAFEAMTSARTQIAAKRKKYFKPVGDGAGMINAELETAIMAADRKSPAAYLAYADWLFAHGETTRAEMIRLSCAGDSKAFDALLADNTELIWDGGLSDHLGNKRPGISSITWHCGFIDEMTMRGFGYTTADRKANAKLVAQVLALPISRLVRKLTFGAGFGGALEWDGMKNDRTDDGVVYAIKASACGPRLESLYLGAETPIDSSDIIASSMHSLNEAAPNLRSLRVDGATMSQMYTLDFPELRTFQRITGGIGYFGSIYQAKWPKIETIEIWFGQTLYPTPRKARDEDLLGVIKHFITASESGALELKHLALKNSEVANGIVALLLDSSLLPRLRTLDLSMSTLTHEGAERLIANASAFAHLEALDLSANYLSDDDTTKLKAALPRANIADQRTKPPHTNDDEYYAVHRYAAGLHTR